MVQRRFTFAPAPQTEYTIFPMPATCASTSFPGEARAIKDILLGGQMSCLPFERRELAAPEHWAGFA